jgi:hypothetical protein
MQPTEVIHVPRGGEVTTADFKPIFSVEDAIDRKRQIGQIIAGVLNEGSDYGSIPGGRDTKILLKPGAEKLASMFGLTPRYIAEVEIEDWTGADHGGEPLFYYKYRCQLYRGERLLGEAIGSCSSWESKYRYRWITAEECAARGIVTDGLPQRGGVQTLTEPEFAINKAETSGQYGKPAEYWQKFKDALAAKTAVAGTKEKRGGGTMPTWSIKVDAKLFRIPNPDVADSVNTCQKMAQKRAFVAVVLVATNASDSFTQDLEDFVDTSTDHIDTGGHPVGTQAAADYVRDKKLEEVRAKAPAPAAAPATAPQATPVAEAIPAQVPEELRLLIEGLPKPGGQRIALEAMRRELIEAMPEIGASEYTRIFLKHGLQPTGGNGLGKLRVAVIEMYALAQEAKTTKAAAQSFTGTDEDLPPSLFPEREVA